MTEPLTPRSLARRNAMLVLANRLIESAEALGADLIAPEQLTNAAYTADKWEIAKEVTRKIEAHLALAFLAIQTS